MHCYHVFYIHVATSEELVSAKQAFVCKHREVDDLTKGEETNTK